MESGTDSQPPAVEEPEQPSAEEVAAGLYRGALDDPATYFGEIDASLVESAEYNYALVSVDGLDAPVMLLRAGGDPATWGGVDSVRVLFVGADGSLSDSGEALARGTAGVGGYRGEVYASARGDGLICSEILSSGTGDTVVSRLAFDGRAWAKRQIHRSELGEGASCLSAIEPEQREVEWLPVDGGSALDALEAGEWEGAVDPAVPDAEDAATQAGLQVFSGTVRVLDDEGLCSLQDIENPNPGYDSGVDHVVLSFDAPLSVEATSGDGQGARSGDAKMLLLATDDEAWAAYDGEAVTVAVDPASMRWPSDTSLPLGEPRAGAFVVLGA